MVARPSPPPSQTRTKSSAPTGGARGAFGHRGQVHVVLDHDRLVQDPPERVQRALVPRGQVHGEPGVTGPRVDHAGAADHEGPQGGHVHAGAGAGPLDDPEDDLDGILGAVGIDAHVRDAAARDVGHGGADQVGLYVQASHVGTGWNDRVQRGVRAAISRLLPHDRHQAAFLQPGQHLRHRDPGHPGVLADLGPGQHLSAEQQVERGPVVELTQQARGTRPGAWLLVSPCLLWLLHRGPFVVAPRLSRRGGSFRLDPATGAIL